ncbi:hypothetical protein BDZ91DRAFT_87580 [Kalaharituber pfeilii]|nr:hypothetical protein BDZ91DRAFT_87580 [Kalaharituber pfeilii]
MSSYLNNSLKSFNNSVKNQSATFFSQKRSVNPPQQSGSSSTPASNYESSLKRKRPIITPTPSTPKIVYSQPADSGQVRDLMSQVHYAITYLKDKEFALTADELGSYLSIELTDTLRHVLRNNERIHYDPKSDTYAFKPIHDIRSAPALLHFLQNQTTAQGLSVKELKDGWSGAIETIGRLEADRDILVTRTKKDNQPRMVWKNDKSLDVDVEDEFKAIWHRITIPEPAELPRCLQEAGLKPTSVDPASIKKATTSHAARKKPKRQRAGRITNIHMSHIIKDFSKPQ